MAENEQKEQLHFGVSISKKESKQIAALPERTKSLLHRKMMSALREALGVIQDYQDLME